MFIKLATEQASAQLIVGTAQYHCLVAAGVLPS